MTKPTKGQQVEILNEDSAWETVTVIALHSMQFSYEREDGTTDIAFYKEIRLVS